MLTGESRIEPAPQRVLQAAQLPALAAIDKVDPNAAVIVVALGRPRFLGLALGLLFLEGVKARGGLLRVSFAPFPLCIGIRNGHYVPE